MRFFVGIYMFWGALIITAVSFISVNAAVMTLVFFAIGLFAILEIQSRKKWEAASSFKLMDVEYKLDELDTEVARNKHNLASLKNTLLEKEENVEAKLENVSVDADETQPFHKSLTIANDDPFADHRSLSDMVVKELLKTAVNQKQIDVFAQPIMHLPQRQPAGFEVFARIRAKPGLYVPAGRYMDMAKSANLLDDIDGLLLQECLSVLRTHADQMNRQFFFINIQPASLKNKKYMSDLLAFVAKNRQMAKKLVFEIRYADYQSLPTKILGIINGLSKLGCGFSLDHVDDTEFHLKDLIKHNVKFIKIKASWMMEQTNNDMDFTHIWRLKNKLEANGVRVIADHIENEDDLRGLLDFDPHYGQGYLFGKPDLIGTYAPFSFAKSNVRRKGIEEKFG